jgi:hypothetical protein
MADASRECHIQQGVCQLFGRRANSAVCVFFASDEFTMVCVGATPIWLANSAYNLTLLSDTMDNYLGFKGN